MHKTIIVRLIIFICNINIANSGLLNPEKLQLNIGQLKLDFGGSKKNNDIYVLESEDDELVEKDDRPDDYKIAKASSFEKGILSKFTGAGIIDHNNEPGKGEVLKRSKVNVKKDEGSEKQTWKEISGMWKERNNNRNTRNHEDVKSSNTSEYSEFDERIYPATLFACTTKEEEGTNISNMDRKSNGMFQKLFRYIQGENTEGLVMKMTAPVFSFIHLDCENNPDKVTMCFWMHQMDKVVAEPKPKTDVFLWRMQPTSFFVRRFSAPGGFGHGQVWEEEMGKMKKGVDMAGLLAAVDPDILAMASYDAPWTTEGRRDEVLLRRKGEEEWSGPWGAL